MSAMPDQATRKVSVAECLAPSGSISVEQLAKELGFFVCALSTAEASQRRRWKTTIKHEKEHIVNQTQPNATSPPISRDRDEVKGDQRSSIGDGLTEALESKLNNPELSSEFDLHAGTNEVLKGVGLTTADSGGKLTFYGRDPILQSPLMTDQVVMSRTPGAFRTVLVPRGSSKAEWLES